MTSTITSTFRNCLKPVQTSTFWIFEFICRLKRRLEATDCVLPLLPLQYTLRESVTWCLRGSIYPAWSLGKPGWEAASGRTAVVQRKWCSGSLCLAEHWVMKRGRGERKGACLEARHGPRVPMQPGRMARWCRTASVLLTCHAAATLSFVQSG